MVQPQLAAYGSWKSPITADVIVAEMTMRGQLALDGQDIYWSEGRPAEGGRSVLVRRTPDGQMREILPAPFNARTRVHEYGGGAFAVSDGVLYFSNFADQRLYRLVPGAEPEPITPATALRYADGVIDRRRGRMICVREDHRETGREASNTLVSIALDGSDNSGGQVLVSGNDFYAAPRLSPDGSRLAWLTWNHPNLPWDGCELWVGEVTSEGTLGQVELVAGGVSESIFQPEWSPENVLHFVSDRTGWWNLYRWRDGNCEPLCQMEAEFGLPYWVFGLSTYGFISPQQIICAYTQQRVDHLARLDTTTGAFEEIASPYSVIAYLRASSQEVVFIGGSPTEHMAVVRLDPQTLRFQALTESSPSTIDAGYLSQPELIEFPTEGGRSAYAFFYPPRNRDYVAPQDERPPLLVSVHGGPTSAANSALKLSIQYWTSRGIAVLDVNYGGSTGYGRAYRDRLRGQWGVVDVDDSVHGAQYLVERGRVDGERLVITGGSAGGYTTLCALCFRDTFKVGACHFGPSELEIFAKETHKYESRYMDYLIGPYPEQRGLYHARSPMYFADQITQPMIFFQGLEDKIVPPNQTEMVVDALRKRGVPVAYLPFEGEQHGFRQAKNIKRALDAQLYFLAHVFNFPLADPVEPVQIDG
ncbi:MAG: prolyl oligopeptidase family serine peptidase [Ktedonobacteraceae bacterium]